MPSARDEAEKKILGVLSEAMRTGDVYLEVPTSDGRMLRLLTEAAGAKAVVEVGTSTGYSGLWLLLGLKNTGGRLTTFEIDRGRAAQARKTLCGGRRRANGDSSGGRCPRKREAVEEIRLTFSSLTPTKRATPIT